MVTTLKHSTLGNVKGNKGDQVVQFLGLKYATLKDRLATAQLLGSYGFDGVDATKYG